MSSQSDTNPTTLTHDLLPREVGREGRRLWQRGICQTRQTTGTELGRLPNKKQNTGTQKYSGMKNRQPQTLGREWQTPSDKGEVCKNQTSNAIKEKSNLRRTAYRN